jgi:hypothetical protein
MSRADTLTWLIIQNQWRLAFVWMRRVVAGIAQGDQILGVVVLLVVIAMMHMEQANLAFIGALWISTLVTVALLDRFLQFFVEFRRIRPHTALPGMVIFTRACLAVGAPFPIRFFSLTLLCNRYLAFGRNIVIAGTVEVFPLVAHAVVKQETAPTTAHACASRREATLAQRVLSAAADLPAHLGLNWSTTSRTLVFELAPDRHVISIRPQR